MTPPEAAPGTAPAAEPPPPGGRAAGGPRRLTRDDRWGGPAQRLGTAVGLVSFVLLLGVVLRHPGFMALGEALAVLAGLAYLQARWAVAAVDARRDPIDRVFEEDEVVQTLRLRNRSRLPLHLLEVGDRFPPGPIPLRRSVVGTLPGRGEAAVRFDDPCTRGRGTYRLGPVELVASDPLGIFRVRRLLPLEQELVVYPRPLPLRDLDLESRLHRGLGGEGGTPHPGHSSSFYALREHRPGEPVRGIHWRASARRGRLLVAEYEAPTHSDVTVALDLDRAVLAGLGRGSNAEVAIRLAAALAQHVIGQGRALQLLADGGQPTALPPGTGERHLLAALHALAHLQPRGTVPYADLLERSTPLLPAGATLVLIFNRSHTATARRLEALGSEWRRRGIRALAFVIDDRGFLRREEHDGPGPGEEPVETLLGRLGVEHAVLGGPRDLCVSRGGFAPPRSPPSPRAAPSVGGGERESARGDPEAVA